MALAACAPAASTHGGPSGAGSGDGYAQLCTGAGFDDGTATDFGSGLIECVCAGSGQGIAKADCETYCADYDVTAEHALLSEQNSTNDKCVCDGTSG